MSKNESSHDDSQTLNNLLLEKASYTTKAARSVTLANILAPILCIPLFKNEVTTVHFTLWLIYMAVATTFRTWSTFKLKHEVIDIQNPQHNLTIVTLGVGAVGFGWGLGWFILTPDLSIVNRMIYLFITTGAMISSMFAYSVHMPMFYTFTLSIMAPALITVLWPSYVFPWPFSVGVATLFFSVIRIGKNFSKTYEDTVKLRFRNKRLYEELANERDQSMAANIAKSKFIASASHDLRQPLHAVNINLELISATQIPSSEKETLDKIKSSITTLNSMFDALLNMSRLDALGMQVNNQYCTLKEFAHVIDDILKPQAINKSLKLEVDCPDWAFIGDKLLLQQILSNLVVNAIQYTRTGSVCIRFFDHKGYLAVQVKDTGVGISVSDQSQIFNEFYRSDKTRSLHEGLGLGLSIVKRLCHVIGAEISVLSRLGEGSVFTVHTSYAIIGETHQDPSKVFIERLPQLQGSGLKGAFIMIFEDDPNIIEAYKITLASRGAQTVVFTDFDEEFDRQLALINRVDCILSDYRLKNITGDVIIHKVRENFNYDIPAVIVTADTSPSHINFFNKLNIPVLHKPISFQEVMNAIETAIVTSKNDLLQLY